MTVRKTTQIGSKALRAVCGDVLNPLEQEVQELVQDMVDTMRETGLIGLAAPQIGSDQRIFVMELRPNQKTDRIEESELYVCINPVTSQFSEETVVMFEGCGSIAHGTLFGRVERPEKITLDFVNEKGDPVSLELDGLLGRVAQHELDHLDGILFLDRMDDPRDLYDTEEYRKLRSRESDKT